jgi:hypothetical protein
LLNDLYQDGNRHSHECVETASNEGDGSSQRGEIKSADGYDRRGRERKSWCSLALAMREVMTGPGTASAVREEEAVFVLDLHLHGFVTGY